MQTDDPASETVPDLAQFLKVLAEEGRAMVSSEALRPDSEAAIAVLRQLDEFARDELGLDAPRFSADAALWAARLFYHLCQLTLCRDIGEERVKAVCGQPCPEPHSPETDWSVDLTLRHLPKLFQLARHLSQADPLVQQLKQIAMAWPLSSVGVPGLENLQFEAWIHHPALLRLYTDRILAIGDAARLGDPRVDDFLRADLGLHHELSPALAGKLFQPTHDTH